MPFFETWTKFCRSRNTQLEFLQQVPTPNAKKTPIENINTSSAAIAAAAAAAAVAAAVVFFGVGGNPERDEIWQAAAAVSVLTVGHATRLLHPQWIDGRE